MVAVAPHHFAPLREEVAGCHLVVYVNAPACALAPGDVAELVGPVIVTLLEYLLVQTRAVESGVLREHDVILECLVGGCGPYSVGIETLVGHEPLEIRLVVQVEFAVRHVYLAHSGV